MIVFLTGVILPNKARLLRNRKDKNYFMYSKQAASLLTQQFWTAFGQYMAPVLSDEGEKINWVNYKTGIKFIKFPMQSVSNTASIAIEFSHPDVVVLQQQFDLLATFKNQFSEECGNNWQWQKMKPDKQEKMIGSITASIENVSIMNKSDWPEIISFFKSHLISLDKFWSNYKFAFE